MANRRFIDFPIASSVGDNDIVLIWQDGMNKQTTKGTLIQGAPTSLEGLTDVDIAGLINGQILQYNSTTGKWENVHRTDINLSELGDVSIVSPSNGQVLVYNSSTSKWENSSGGYVPYTGAVTTVNLGSQTIQAGSFVKAGGTSSQFLKADGSVDSTTYGTGTVTSVGLTMPSAFSVANTPVTTAGTLAVTATGTTAQYIQGDGSLATFPSLTGFVPYTGATADVNLGTHDLAAERGTFENNGSSNTLTVNHTSGSGYGIIVTKGGNNEALYVSKTSGSGNAMTVVGGRTSLVDLALSSVTNTAGDFLTISGGVVHKRTAAQTLTDIGGQAALTNPVTGTGASGQVAYFTGTSAISSESNLFWDATNDRLGIGVTPSAPLHVVNSSNGFIYRFAGGTSSAITGGIFAEVGRNFASIGTISNHAFNIFTADFDRFAIFTNGNVTIGNDPTDAGFKLDVNGTGRFSGALTATTATLSGSGADRLIMTRTSFGTYHLSISSTNRFSIYDPAADTERISITSGGNVGIGTASVFAPLHLIANGNFSNSGNMSTGFVISNGITGRALNLGTFDSGGYSWIQAAYINNADTTFALTLQPRGGNVLIGTTTDSGFKLDVNGRSRFVGATGLPNTSGTSQNGTLRLQVAGYGTVLDFGAQGPTTGKQWIQVTDASDLSITYPLLLNPNGGEVLVGGNTDNGAYNLQCNGTGVWGAGAYVNGSDRNIKDNISTIEKGLEYIEKMNPVRFKYKPNYTRDHTMQTGFIAQELQEVFVNEDYLSGLVQNGVHLSVAYQNLLPILVKAIQELNEKIK
jgi:hypothetical protein